jgi:hypothetical protein
MDDNDFMLHEGTLEDAAAQPSRRATTKSAVEARQGVISGRVILVLLTSLILAVVALAVGYWTVR